MKIASSRNRSPWARGAGLLLAALVTVSLPVVLTLRAVSSQLHSPARIKQLVTMELVDSGALRQLVVRTMLTETGMGQEGLGRLTAGMEPEELDALASVVAPDDWLEAQLRAGVDELFAWLESDRPVPEFTLDLEVLRQHLASGGAERAVDIVMASWPPCTQSQLEIVATAALDGDGSLPIITCLPPEPYQSPLREALILAAEEEMATLPASMALSDGAAGGETVAEYRELKSALLGLRWLGRWGWLVPAGLLGLTMAVAVRSPRDWALWWGIPLLAGGLLTVFLVVVLGGVTEGHLTGLAARLDAPASFRRALEAISMKWLEAVLGSLLLSGLGLMGGGGALALLGWWLPGRRG